MNLLLLFATGWAMDQRNVQYSPEDAAVIIGYLRKAGQEIPQNLLDMQPRNNDMQPRNNVIQYENNVINIQNDSIDNIEKDWACSACTLINLGKSKLDQCEICDTPKPKTEQIALIESSIADLSLNSVQIKNQALPEGFEKPALTGSKLNVKGEEETDWKRKIFKQISAGESVDDVTLSKMMYSNPIEPAIMIDSSMTKQELAEQIKEAYWYKVDDNFEYKNFWSIKQRALVREFIDLLNEAALKSKNLFSVLKDFEKKAWLAIPYGFRNCLCSDPYHNSFKPAKEALVLIYALQNPKLPKQDDTKFDMLRDEFDTKQSYCSENEKKLLLELKTRLIQDLKNLNNSNNFSVYKVINNIAMDTKFIL